MLPELKLQVNDALVLVPDESGHSRSLICIEERRSMFRFFNEGDLFWLTRLAVNDLLGNGGMIIRGDE